MVREKFFQSLKLLFNDDPDTLFQILFAIEHKLLHCYNAVQNLLPQIDDLCKLFGPQFDNRRQQELDEFYSLIQMALETKLQIGNPNHKLQGPLTFKQGETFNQYIYRLIDQYHAIIDNSLLTQYKRSFIVSYIQCQFCLHNKCQNCGCEKVKLQIESQNCLRLDVTGSDSDVFVAFITYQGTVYQTLKYQIIDHTIIPANNWKQLINNIFRLFMVEFNQLTLEASNVITLQTDTGTRYCKFFFTNFAQKPNALVVNSQICNIAPITSLQTLFENEKICICFQWFVQEKSDCIPVAVSSAKDYDSKDIIKIPNYPLTIPFLLFFNSNESNYHSIMDALKQHLINIIPDIQISDCVIYITNDSERRNLFNCQNWHQYNFQIDLLHILIDTNSEIIVLTKQQLPAFNVCYVYYIFIYINSCTLVYLCSFI